MANNKLKIILLCGVLLLLTVIFQLWRNAGEILPGERPEITDPYLLEGKRLSQIYCSSCHMYPDPALLPKSTWRFETLPEIAPFLGIDRYRLPYDPDRNPYLPDNLYPDEPIITQAQWQNIQDFYWHVAPDTLLPAEEKAEIVVDSLFFKARTPEYRSEDEPVVTAVKFDPENRLIYLSDSNNSKFMIFDQDLNLVHDSILESPLSDIRIINDDPGTGFREFLFTFIGYLLPSDVPYGSVARGWYNTDSQESGIASVLYDGITRPVASQFVDLNQNGLEDLLINEFGHRAGSLFWVEMTENDTQQEKKVLIDVPGCIQSYILDYTKNGRPDIVTLCTQTDQTIYLFSNLGEGNFERKTLLEFEITAGSSSFELHDFNGDGHLDILYTSGDNADYSQIFKPYHGVYIYLADGQGSFTKEWFYPINGAYNAKARDFNGNGLLDIAVISFFADYENIPEEGFVFFKNEGNLSFTPYHHPKGSVGRWLTIDVADWTGNGREDIILGNSSTGPPGASNAADHIQDSWREGPHFLLLENLSD